MSESVCALWGRGAQLKWEDKIFVEKPLPISHQIFQANLLITSPSRSSTSHHPVIAYNHQQALLYSSYINIVCVTVSEYAKMWYDNFDTVNNLRCTGWTKKWSVTLTIITRTILSKCTNFKIMRKRRLEVMTMQIPACIHMSEFYCLSAFYWSAVINYRINVF